MIIFVIISGALMKWILHTYRKNWSSHLDVTMRFEKNTMVEGGNGRRI